MLKKLILSAFILLMFSSYSSAGFYSNYTKESGTVIAAIQLKDKGLYNLIVTIQFMRRPQESKIYKSDEYEQIVDHLLVESRGVALQRILERKDIALTDFADLKKVIETDIKKKIDEKKKKFIPDQNVEVVFAISDFYLLEPKDKD